MAPYKKKYKSIDPKTGLPRTKLSKKWWIKYRDGAGVLQRRPGCTDKSATQRLESKLEREAELVRAGIEDPLQHHLKRPLSTHLDDYEEFLRAKGNSEGHVKQVSWRARQIIDGCHFKLPADVSASKVQKFLAELRKTGPDDRELKYPGRSAQTANHYLRAIKQLVNWMVRERRLPSNPLAVLQQFNVRKDRRHDRRALRPDELGRLLDAAGRGPIVEGVPGPDRVMIYLMAAFTGLRRRELALLTRKSLELDGDRPNVSVDATDTKNGRDCKLPLHPYVVEILRDWLTVKDDTPNQFILPLRTSNGSLRRTSKMMERDLNAARQAWIEEATEPIEQNSRDASDFLCYKGRDGRFADFHGHRHTFISNVAKDAKPKTTQLLARHSSFRQTFDIYTHQLWEDQFQAILALPVPKSANRTSPHLTSSAADHSAVPPVVPSGAQIGASPETLPGNQLALDGKIDRWEPSRQPRPWSATNR